LIYKIKEPTTSIDWENYYLLRWKLLRMNLGLEKGTEKDQFESISYHRIVKYGSNIIGVGRLHFVNEFQAQIRFMAIEIEYRNAGLGRMLIEELIFIAKNRKIEKIFLNSRESAVGFYQKFGFIKVRPVDTKFNINHYLMEKKL
tara:strand:- start:2655 stop:3086 length:432 start_codon:yes stop_codon:yes gene_type:complete